MKLREHPLSKRFLDCLKIYLQEPGKCAVTPVPICQDAVKVRMIIKRLACCLHGEDSGESTLGDAEKCPPSGAEEDRVEFAVVHKEDSQALWDGKDSVADFGELSRAVGNLLGDFAVDVFCELHRLFRPAGLAYPSALAREGDKRECLHPSQ